LVNKLDIAIAGGGLSGGLIALRLKQLHPELSVAVFEREDKLGGEHTWSFHDSDIAPELNEWLAPLVTSKWEKQTVSFPAYKRELTTPYRSVTSHNLHEVVSKACADDIQISAPINFVTPHQLGFDDGKIVDAKAVIDCRGDRKNPHMILGFQKFVGLECVFETPHHVQAPVIMDATVSQKDGYRFIYLLPFDDHRMLIEDTRYADGHELDKDTLVGEIEDYIKQKKWGAFRCVRHEEGVLPIALAGDFEKFWPDDSKEVARGGMRAGLFHPLTGYSLPYAVELAEKIASSLAMNVNDFSTRTLVNVTRRYAKEQWQKGAFYRLLCRMLFQAADPAKRYLVLQRFYRLPQPLIERFYGGRSTSIDKARILMGKPPVPVMRAFGCLSERKCLKGQRQNLYKEFN